MAPPHSSKSGGFGNLFSPSLFSSVESTKQTSQAPTSSIFSSPQTNSFGRSFVASPSMPAFGTSNTAAAFNRNTTTEPAFGISSTSSSMPSSSASPTFGFPSTDPGFTNTRNSFGGSPDASKTPLWGSNSGASKPLPFGSTEFNSNLPSSPFHGPFGQKPTTNFSFLPFPNMNNSGGAPNPVGSSFVASSSIPAVVTSNTPELEPTANPFGSSFVASSLIGGAAGFNRNTTPEPAGGISSTSSALPLSSASPKLGFPSTGPGFANKRSPFGGAPNPFGSSFVGSSSIPAFETSNTVAGFNQNTTPIPADGISSSSFTFLLSSASPKLDFPSTGPGIANTRNPFGCDPNVPKTPTWGSNLGASRSSPFGCNNFSSNPPSPTSLGPFGQKPTATFSFLHTNNSENPFSASLFRSKSGQPPLSSQNGGSRVTPYSASKMVDEDCTKVISISAMPVYSVKSHEELRLEDYQQSTKANPFSTSLSSNNEVHPPLASQNKGSGVVPYTLTKPVDEDSAKLTSISAMPVYEVKSHEELRWEDYQLKNEGGNDVAGALNWRPNLFIPSPSLMQTSESPPPFSFKIPIDAASFYPFPSIQNANIATQTSKRPSPFSVKIPNTTSFFGPFPFQPSKETPLSSTPTNIISGESRIQESPTNPNLTWQPLTNTIAVPCTACGCIKTDAFPLQVQITPESCQTKSTDPAVAKPPIMADNIVRVKDPFGVQSSKSQLFADHATPATSIRIGISSMPVVDKPAPSRIYSRLTLRHVSQRQSTVHLKKGQPKSHVEKVPFFARADPNGIPRPINHPIPRENPKSAFMMNIPEPTDDSVEEDILHIATSLELVPKLTRSDYYTEPLISELETKESLDPGFCGRVRGFVIGRHGYGKIEFEGETDVRGLDLDSLVEFNAKEVVVYKDESKKVGVGKGLNKPALVTLMNVKCMDKKNGEVFVHGDQVAKYERMLKKMAQKQGAEFVSYDPVKGEWKFHVRHF